MEGAFDLKKVSKVKKKILKIIWELGIPVTVREIADKMRIPARSANMHLLGLKRQKFVKKTESGYMVTEEGSEAIGFPKTNKALAERILSETPLENAFHFYADIGKPLGVFANSLSDFSEKVRFIDIESLTFHLRRGDFESWINLLGDRKLAERLGKIRKANYAGEALRNILYTTLKWRHDELIASMQG
jgi:Mn-dependent DtxR family transcriptional regulator